MSDVPEGYRMSEVGVIPEEWAIKDLGGAAEVVMGQSPVGTSYNRSGTGAPLINGPTEFTEKYPIKIQWTSQPTKFCKKGDVLLCVRGSSTGRINISDDEYCIGRGVAAIRAKSCADTSFITFQVDSAVKSILALTTGSTFPNIDGKSIRAIQFPFPPLSEQQAIASALSDVDALITALEQLITKKRNIKQGAMQQLLTGKKRLPGFGGVWKVINIAENSVLKARIGWQGLTTAEYLKNGEYYLVTGTDFIEGKINWSGCHFIDENRYVQDKNIQLRNDDVLITKDGTIGKVGYVDNLPGKATLNSGVFVIRPRDKSYFPPFFYYVLKSNIFDTFMKQLRAGSTISHLYQKDFVDFSFSVPSIPEQQAIAQILSDMDAEIEALKQKRDKYKAIKQGMMQELLTGKTRLVKEDKT